MATDDKPCGMHSTTGSDGSYCDRPGTPGFPSGEVQTVQQQNSFADPRPTQMGGPAGGPPTK